MRLRILVAVAIVAAAVAVGVARPWAERGHSGAVVAQSSLRPGGFAVVVRNDSDDTLRIAQVSVADAFVSFRGRHLVLAPHERTRLSIDYDWVKGQPYEIDVLTSTGAILSSEVGDTAAG
jgi:hypothetical protein